mmetsp:Transcript_1081/g.3363  ORF Transcript_1081/g.3363 Transcript_1081/m.3363 type:complete len:289 (-) Transcript_1081:1472-2338(-)
MQEVGVEPDCVVLASTDSDALAPPRQLEVGVLPAPPEDPHALVALAVFYRPEDETLACAEEGRVGLPWRGAEGSENSSLAVPQEQKRRSSPACAAEKSLQGDAMEGGGVEELPGIDDAEANGNGGSQGDDLCLRGNHGGGLHREPLLVVPHQLGHLLAVLENRRESLRSARDVALKFLKRLHGALDLLGDGRNMFQLWLVYQDDSAELDRRSAIPFYHDLLIELRTCGRVTSPHGDLKLHDLLNWDSDLTFLYPHHPCVLVDSQRLEDDQRWQDHAEAADGTSRHGTS